MIQVEMFQKAFSVIKWMILVIAIITIILLLIWSMSWWWMWWWRCCWCTYELLMMIMMMKVDVVVVPFPLPSFVLSQHFSNHLVMTQNIRQPLLSASPRSSIMSISSESLSVYMCKFLSKCTNMAGSVSTQDLIHVLVFCLPVCLSFVYQIHF